MGIVGKRSERKVIALNLQLEVFHQFLQLENNLSTFFAESVNNAGSSNAAASTNGSAPITLNSMFTSLSPVASSAAGGAAGGANPNESFKPYILEELEKCLTLFKQSIATNTLKLKPSSEHSTTTSNSRRAVTTLVPSKSVLKRMNLDLKSKLMRRAGNGGEQSIADRLDSVVNGFRQEIDRSAAIPAARLQRLLIQATVFNATLQTLQSYALEEANKPM